MYSYDLQTQLQTYIDLKRQLLFLKRENDQLQEEISATNYAGYTVSVNQASFHMARILTSQAQLETIKELTNKITSLKAELVRVFEALKGGNVSGAFFDPRTYGRPTRVREDYTFSLVDGEIVYN